MCDTNCFFNSSDCRGAPPLLLSSSFAFDPKRSVLTASAACAIPRRSLFFSRPKRANATAFESDHAVKPHNVTTHYQLLAGADAGAAAVASAAACAAAFARAALSISSRAIFLASMSSTLVGEGAAVAARDKSRGPSPAAASKARRDARWVAHREHAHDGVHCASPQDAQTTREGPEPGRLVAAMRVRPRVAELRRVVHRKGSRAGQTRRVRGGCRDECADRMLP